MAVSLFTHGQITTTLPKAKAVKPFVEKLITAAKKGDLAARRRVVSAIGDPILVDRDLKQATRSELRDDGYVVNKYHELVNGPRVVKKLFDEIAPRYVDRKGGYTRIIKLSKHRIGDGSDLCVLQLVGTGESGPQVAGRYSRRRDMANRRMELAAALRKGQAAPATEQDQAEATAATDDDQPQAREASEGQAEEEADVDKKSAGQSST